MTCPLCGDRGWHDDRHGYKMLGVPLREFAADLLRLMPKAGSAKRRDD